MSSPLVLVIFWERFETRSLEILDECLITPMLPLAAGPGVASNVCKQVSQATTSAEDYSHSFASYVVASVIQLAMFTGSYKGERIMHEVSKEVSEDSTE